MNARAASSLATPFSPARDIVRRFLAWTQRADAEQRAEAASALARAYLHSGLPAPMRAEAVAAMTALVDDPSISVRRALAEALAGASDTPRGLALALANDRSEVAAAVLARSPVLTDADLVDCAAIGDPAVQCAIARRPNLGLGPSAALAEIGGREAALALIGNLDADLSGGVLRRLVERFGDDAEAREALLQRPSSPAWLKAEIAMAAAKDLRDSAARWLGRGRATRIAREAGEQTIAFIAASCRREELAELARSLRERGQLTMALLLRSALCGERELLVAALVELTRLPYRRVAAVMRDPHGEGFAALALRAGLPGHALTAFRVTLDSLETCRWARGEGLKLPLIEKVIAACEKRDEPALANILSLLWRFAAEAARAEARGFARLATVDGPLRLPPSLDFSPANDLVGEPALLTVLAESPRSDAAAAGRVDSLTAPDGDADARFELLIDVGPPCSQTANESRSPAAVFGAPDLGAAVEEPDSEAAPDVELLIDAVAAFERTANEEGDESRSPTVIDAPAASAEAPGSGATRVEPDDDAGLRIGQPLEFTALEAA